MNTQTIGNLEGGAGIVAAKTLGSFDLQNRWLASNTPYTSGVIENFRRGSQLGINRGSCVSDVATAIRTFRQKNKTPSALELAERIPAERRLIQKYMDAHKGHVVSVELECVFYRESMIPKKNDLNTCLAEIDGDGSLRYIVTRDEDMDGGDEEGEEENNRENVRHGTAEVKLMFRPDRIARLKKVLDKLRACGAEVNTSCGTHIHLDQRDVKRRQADIRAKRLIKSLPALAKLVAPSRLENNYCKLNRPVSFGRAYHHPHCRYYAINFHSAFQKYGTIEVRMHGGTLDVWKIHGWVQLCRWISLSSEIDKKAEENLRNNRNGIVLNDTDSEQHVHLERPRLLQISIEDLIRMETLPHHLRLYVWRRFRQFNIGEADALRDRLFESEQYNLTDGMAIS